MVPGLINPAGMQAPIGGLVKRPMPVPPQRPMSLLQGAYSNTPPQMPPPRRLMADGGSAKTVRVHVGPIHSAVAGRTDHLPMHVPSGSYVIPADIVSGMGEGNTIAGFAHMRRMFGGTPYRGGAMPYGAHGGPYGEALPRADGGRTETVPIVAAGGEYVLSPEQVRHAGEGDMDMGHRVLDEFIKRMRANVVKTMTNLPGPAKN
jgi:hypothetical protein